jgi:exodeoxyribonuclease V alpha subunit
MTATLDPRGTLRALVDRATVDDDVFRRLGIGARRCDLGDQGLYLAEELVAADRWLDGPDQREALALLVLALLVAQRQGASRLPLAAAELRPLIAELARLANGAEAAAGGSHKIDLPRTLRTIAHLTGQPRLNSVIGAGDQRRPLVVDDGAPYTERARWLEERIAASLARRLRPLPAPPDHAAAVAAVLARPGKATLSNEQAAAVRRATTGRLAIVTGGPGTGKTAVAAAILRVLHRTGRGPIALAAPTGKAANRLAEVIAAQLAAIASPDDHDRALAPPPAQTLHRLLGYRDDGFARHADSPLPVGALLVDEASMIDLELMDAILDALPEGAPLILLGDARQLPAVDAGQILIDLAAADDPAAPLVSRLTHSYRMDAADPRGAAVLAAAAALDAGEPARLTDGAGRLATVRKTPESLTFRGVEWIDAPTPDATLAVAAALWRTLEHPAAERVFRFVDGKVAADHRGDLEALWQAMQRARLLTVTRALSTGALAVNAHLHDLVLDRRSVAGRPDYVPGEPVMMTANDYHRGLFNGDQGLIVRADEGAGGHRYRALFRVAGELTPFALEALRDRLELSWAMTVHKAQGSELDAVALILPDDDLPLLTRELLYTAVTRARSGVVIAGRRAVLVAGGKRHAQRHSGLTRRLARHAGLP